MKIVGNIKVSMTRQEVLALGKAVVAVRDDSLHNASFTIDERIVIHNFCSMAKIIEDGEL